MTIKQKLTTLLLLVAGAVTQLNAQVAVTVGSRVTELNKLVDGNAYLIQSDLSGTPYIEDKTTYYYAPTTQNAATELTAYYLIKSGDKWLVKNVYTGKYWGAPTASAGSSTTPNGFAPSDLENAGAWTLTCSNSNFTFKCNDLYPNRNNTTLIPHTSASTFKIYEVAITYPINITSGWYQIKWVSLGSQTGTGYPSDSEVAGKYVRNYATEVTVSDKTYPLYLANAPTTIQENAASLVYVDFIETVSQNGKDLSGVHCSLRSANGHYISIDGSSSITATDNYIVYVSSSTPYISTITSGSSGTRNSLVPRGGGDATPYIGQTDAGKFPKVNMYAVNPAYLGLQPWSVSIECEEDVQVTYSGSSAYGLTSVYDGGTFFLSSGVTPTANEFSAPTVGGTSAIINIDATNHIIRVLYPIIPAINKVYTITNTNIGATRGSLIYHPDVSTKWVWATGKSGTFDSSAPNSQWVLIPTGTANQYYLYNVGAQKFAIPMKGGTYGNGQSYSWGFSDKAVAVYLTRQDDGSYKIKSVAHDVVVSISTGYDGPVIFYDDDGAKFYISKVDGTDQSTAANAAKNKIIDYVTPLTAVNDLSADGWYAIRVRVHNDYADRYIYTAESEVNYNGTNYPLTFDYAENAEVNVRPSMKDATYFTRILKDDNNKVYWQMPNGKYLYGSNNKFPISTATKSTFSMDYTSGSGFRMWGSSRYAVPYYLGSQYFIGETSSSGNAYFDIYPVNLTDAGLTAWQVTVEGLSSDTKVTCTRSDLSGLNAVYTNGHFFLPTGQTPAQGEFTATVSGSTMTLPVTIDATAHTITASVPVLTINSPQAEATFTWNGESKTGQTVTFPYTGETITSNTITVSYSGNLFQSPTLSQSTWDGTASATVTCTMTPAFFSTNYGDKWVRIVSAKAPTLVVNLDNVAAGASTKMAAHDYFDAAQLWCLVGNSSSFTLYNKAAGSGYVLTSGAASPVQNTTISLQPAASATNATWTLGDGQLTSSDAPGYILYAATGNGDNSLHGWQSGNTVKYWGATSGGSHFLIEDASGEVTLELAGLDPASMTVYTQNIAVLPSTIAGSSSETLLTKDNFSTSSTAFVPTGSELTFGTPKMFMNYGFTGYDGSDQTKTVTATSTPQTVTATFSVVRPDARYLWEPLRVYNGSGEKDYYRIPAIVTAKNGDIIAINDRRYNNDTDLGNNSGTASNPVDHHIDIIGVASSDNGNTWGSEFMIMDGTGSGVLAGYGDAAVVADRESNKVLVMACAGNVFYTGQNNSYHQTLQRTVLTHNGTTWVAETPTDVTNQFFAGSLASSDGMFIGSGAISQSKIIKKGDYYRIYCAVLERSDSNFVFYSDDFGLTWTMMGSTAPANDNEPKVEELPDGSVLLSVRKYNGRTFNVWTWNDDTYTTGSWGTAVASNNQTGGISFGGNSTNGDIRMIPAIKKATGEMVTLAMQSVPTGSGRSNVSIYYKELDPEVTYTPTTIAQNWSSAFGVTPHASAYSSFNSQPDGRIAFYMEEAPKAVTGYYMCYVPLTLDEITDNHYTGIASTYPVTLNAVGGANYATLYLPFDVTTDANTKAYYIGSTTNGYAQLTELTDGEIAANTAVLLINETASSATFNVTSGLTQQISESDNHLKGTLTSMSLDLSDGTNYYSLGKIESQIGFYKFSGGTITLGANKAYLDTTAPSNPGVKGFVFDFDDATSINELRMKDEESNVGAIYNLSGQRMSKMQKGINIVGGKKVLK